MLDVKDELRSDPVPEQPDDEEEEANGGNGNEWRNGNSNGARADMNESNTDPEPHGTGIREDGYVTLSFLAF